VPVGEITCALQNEYEPREGYLLVRVTGEAVMEPLIRSSGQALERANALGYKAILVDATGLTGALGVLERFNLGVHFAVHWDLSVRVAMVLSAETLAERKFLENVARNRAVPVRLFSDSGEAVTWLLSDPSPPVGEFEGGGPL